MSKTDDGGTAFPFAEPNLHTEPVAALHFGMSLRHYFAARAPRKIPKWFNCDDKLPDKPIDNTVQPTRGGRGDETPLGSIHSFMGEFTSEDPDDWTEEDFPDDCLPETRAKVIEIGREWKKYRDEYRQFELQLAAWQEAVERTCFYLWRYAYADDMIAFGKLTATSDISSKPIDTWPPPMPDPLDVVVIKAEEDLYFVGTIDEVWFLTRDRVLQAFKSNNERVDVEDFETHTAASDALDNLRRHWEIINATV